MKHLLIMLVALGLAVGLVACRTGDRNGTLGNDAQDGMVDRNGSEDGVIGDDAARDALRRAEEDYRDAREDERVAERESGENTNGNNTNGNNTNGNSTNGSNTNGSTEPDGNVAGGSDGAPADSPESGIDGGTGTVRNGLNRFVGRNGGRMPRDPDGRTGAVKTPANAVREPLA